MTIKHSASRFCISAALRTILLLRQQDEIVHSHAFTKILINIHHIKLKSKYVIAVHDISEADLHHLVHVCAEILSQYDRVELVAWG